MPVSDTTLLDLAREARLDPLTMHLYSATDLAEIVIELAGLRDSIDKHAGHDVFLVNQHGVREGWRLPNDMVVGPHDFELDPAWHPSDPGPVRPCEHCGVDEHYHTEFGLDVDQVTSNEPGWNTIDETVDSRYTVWCESCSARFEVPDA